MNDQVIWAEKYRPKTIDDTILPKGLKTTLQYAITDGQIQNMIFAGSAGIGKTTAAKAICEQLGADYIVINASMKGNIDTLRVEIQNFASTVSFSGGRKYVILDEADHLNAQSTQPALRNFMDQFAHNCGFILTCNLPNMIIEPLRSRCPVVNFNATGEDRTAIAKGFFDRVLSILDQENIQYEKAVVAQVIKENFPDFRRTLNLLQRYSATGQIDTGILVDLNDKIYEELISFMKDKDIKGIRRWCGEHSDIDCNTIFEHVYNTAYRYFTDGCVPAVIVTIGKYQYQHAFVANPEINIAACLIELAIEGSYK